MDQKGACGREIIPQDLGHSQTHVFRTNGTKHEHLRFDSFLNCLWIDIDIDFLGDDFGLDACLSLALFYSVSKSKRWPTSAQYCPSSFTVHRSILIGYSNRRDFLILLVDLLDMLVTDGQTDVITVSTYFLLRMSGEQSTYSIWLVTNEHARLSDQQGEWKSNHNLSHMF